MMGRELSYRDYVTDDAHMENYRSYQERYAQQVRESDKQLIEMVRTRLTEPLVHRRPLTLLDLGCSTGNFLLHLKRAGLGLELCGGDIVSKVITACRNNPELAGIQFAEMDMLTLPDEPRFDIVVTNASLMFFNEDEFSRALRNIAKVTVEDGWFFAFDYFHPFEQEVAIVERSVLHPHGLKFHFRGYRTVTKDLLAVGFQAPTFRPFRIPIDLRRPDDPTDINTYTIPLRAGDRLPFRGTLFQPWCFLASQKVSDVKQQ